MTPVLATPSPEKPPNVFDLYFMLDRLKVWPWFLALVLLAAFAWAQPFPKGAGRWLLRIGTTLLLAGNLMNASYHGESIGLSRAYDDFLAADFVIGSSGFLCVAGILLLLRQRSRQRFSLPDPAE